MNIQKKKRKDLTENLKTLKINGKTSWTKVIHTIILILQEVVVILIQKQKKFYHFWKKRLLKEENYAKALSISKEQMMYFAEEKQDGDILHPMETK